MFIYCSGVLIQVDGDDVSKISQTVEYFQKLSGRQPIKTALLDDGLLLVYEDRKSNHNNVCTLDIVS